MHQRTQKKQSTHTQTTITLRQYQHNSRQKLRSQKLQRRHNHTVKYQPFTQRRLTQPNQQSRTNPYLRQNPNAPNLQHQLHGPDRRRRQHPDRLQPGPEPSLNLALHQPRTPRLTPRAITHMPGCTSLLFQNSLKRLRPTHYTTVA